MDYRRLRYTLELVSPLRPPYFPLSFGSTCPFFYLYLAAHHLFTAPKTALKYFLIKPLTSCEYLYLCHLLRHEFFFFFLSFFFLTQFLLLLHATSDKHRFNSNSSPPLEILVCYFLFLFWKVQFYLFLPIFRKRIPISNVNVSGHVR